jgi:hypothetical protein
MEFRISALQVSRNRGGNSLGSRVPKVGKSDRWQESVSKVKDSGEDRWHTCRQVESRLR